VRLHAVRFLIESSYNPHRIFIDVQAYGQRCPLGVDMLWYLLIFADIRSDLLIVVGIC